MVDKAQAPPFLTVGQFAKQLNRSDERVRQLVDSGQVAAVRLAGGQRLIPVAEAARVLALRAGAGGDDA